VLLNKEAVRTFLLSPVELLNIHGRVE